MLNVQGQATVPRTVGVMKKKGLSRTPTSFPPAHSQDSCHREAELGALYHPFNPWREEDVILVTAPHLIFSLVSPWAGAWEDLPEVWGSGPDRRWALVPDLGSSCLPSCQHPMDLRDRLPVPCCPSPGLPYLR